MKSIKALMFGTLMLLASLSAAPASAFFTGMDCQAYTACPYGGTIYCHLLGSPATLCTWEVVPWRAVRCTGFDMYGRWQIVEFHCPGTW